ETERDSATGREDSLDAAPQIGSGDARRTDDRRLDVETAHVQDAFGVHTRIAASAHDLFVARPLAFVDETALDPPGERMEPEHRFHEHVDGRRQVVATAHVTEFVHDDRVELGPREPIDDAVGQDEHGSADADDARLAKIARRDDRYVDGHE